MEHLEDGSDQHGDDGTGDVAGSLSLLLDTDDIDNHLGGLVRVLICGDVVGEGSGMALLVECVGECWSGEAGICDSVLAEIMLVWDVSSFDNKHVLDGRYVVTHIESDENDRLGCCESRSSQGRTTSSLSHPKINKGQDSREWVFFFSRSVPDRVYRMQCRPFDQCQPCQSVDG